jgi:hypothetical protein
MEYVQNLQAESESIFAQDQVLPHLLIENTSFRVCGEG